MGRKKIVLPSKRTQFLSTFRQQSFSLPVDSLIYYILKNPKSAKVHQKLFKSCKYFFIKKSFIVISQALFKSYGLAGIKFDFKDLNLSKISSKLWITDEITIFPHSRKPNFVSSVIQRIFQSDIKTFWLSRTRISFKDFIFVASKTEEIRFSNVSVISEDGTSVVPIEKIIKALPNIKRFEYINKLNDIRLEGFSIKTAEELIKIPHFPNLEKFDLHNIPESFNITQFFDYIKKNKRTKFELSFKNTISDAYKNQLEKIIDEILSTENHDYKPPFINYSGIDVEKYWKLDFYNY